MHAQYRDWHRIPGLEYVSGRQKLSRELTDGLTFGGPPNEM